MEEFNTIPKSGTFGTAVDAINANFGLVSLALASIQDGKSAYELWREQPGNLSKTLEEFFAWVKSSDYAVAYAASDAAVTQEKTIYCVADAEDANVWYEKIRAGGAVHTLAKHSGSLAGLADTFVQVGQHEIDDLALEDESGNMVAAFRDGHFRTKNFDSSSVPHVAGGDYDLSFADESGNTLMLLRGGHIKTKNFDSANIGGSRLSIYCIGDSTTQGQSGITNPIDDASASDAENCYPNRLQDMLGDSAVVYNHGVGGQTTGEILARCGFLDAIVETAFTLKGDGTASLLCAATQGGADGALVDSRCGEPCNYLMQQGTEQSRAQMTRCYVHGVPCVLECESGTLYIRRAETAAHDVDVHVGAHLTFGGNGREGIYLFRMGTNDVLEYSSAMNVDNYMSKLRAATSLVPGCRYVVMGLFHGYEPTTSAYAVWEEMNARLAAEYGSRYIDGIGYLTSQEAFAQRNVTPTRDEDISAERQAAGVRSDRYCIAHRMLPSSFWRCSCTPQHPSVDAIHLNYDGYWLMAKMFVDKMKELNWI